MTASSGTRPRGTGRGRGCQDCWNQAKKDCPTCGAALAARAMASTAPSTSRASESSHPSTVSFRGSMPLSTSNISLHPPSIASSPLDEKHAKDPEIFPPQSSQTPCQGIRVGVELFGGDELDGGVPVRGGKQNEQDGWAARISDGGEHHQAHIQGHIL